MRPAPKQPAAAAAAAGVSPVVRKLLLLHLVALGPALLLGLALVGAAPYAPRSRMRRLAEVELTSEDSAGFIVSDAVSARRLVDGNSSGPSAVIGASSGSRDGSIGSGSGSDSSGSGSGGSGSGSGSGFGSGHGSAHHLPAGLLATFVTLAAGDLIMQVFRNLAVP